MNKLWVLSVLLIFLLTGCWDKIEIEDRGFIIGVGIDKGEEENQIKLTQQMVIPGGIESGAGQGGSGGEGGSDAFINIDETGEAPFEIIREVAAKTSRTPFYAHVQVIIVSEEILKEKKLDQLLDFYLRYHEMRRNAVILISKDKASDVLNVVPKNEKLPANYIMSLLENTYRNAEIYPKTRIGDVHENMLDKESFPLTIVESAENDKAIELKNTAIIKGNTLKLEGYMDRKGTIGLNFIKNNIEGGVLKGEYEGKPVLYDIFKSKTKVTADINNVDEIIYTVEVDLEGTLGESLTTLDFLKQENVKKIESVIEDEIESMIKTAFKKAQEFNTDIFEFGVHLKRNHYPTWVKIKDDWEEGKNYFSKTSINTDARVIIRDPGSVNN